MDTSACVFVSLVAPSWYNVRHIDDGGGVDDVDDDVFANNYEYELT